MIRTNITALSIGLATLLSWSAMTAVVTQAQDVFGYSTGEHSHGEDEQLAAFRTAGNGWTFSTGGSSGLGRPATLTWSVVPDNSPMPTGLGEPVSNSDLIAFLDGVHHGGNSPGGTDLTQRTWWQLMNSAFERWEELSGITFNYEPNDDGRKLGTANGVLGTRGDHRLGGHSIDGQTSPTFLAYNFFPNNSDTVIDTDEINRWSNASNNFRLFRNMLMHEIGHGVGLNHVESFDIIPSSPKFQFGTFLMEPILTSRFDGPQLDDILGAHRLYGDANEAGTGNDTFLNATQLGTLLHGQTISIGTDAVDTSVAPSDLDFVSIDDNSDVDYFRFSINAAETLHLALTPMGPTYDEGRQGSGDGGTQQPLDASAQSDLTLTLLSTNGTSLLEFSNDTGLGMREEILNHHLAIAGDYYVLVGGLNNAAQFFQLDITAVPEPTSLLLLLVGSIVTASRQFQSVTGRTLRSVPVGWGRASAIGDGV